MIDGLNTQKWFLVLVDDYVRFTWFYMLHHKYELNCLLINFTTSYNQNFRQQLNNFYLIIFNSENVQFFISEDMKHMKFYTKQNGFVERKIGISRKKTRVVLFES